jgi:hypothetical protein
VAVQHRDHRDARLMVILALARSWAYLYGLVDLAMASNLPVLKYLQTRGTVRKVLKLASTTCVTFRVAASQSRANQCKPDASPRRSPNASMMVNRCEQDQLVIRPK